MSEQMNKYISYTELRVLRGINDNSVVVCVLGHSDSGECVS